MLFNGIMYLAVRAVHWIQYISELLYGVLNPVLVALHAIAYLIISSML
jgi:hypothetical protein